MYDDPYMCFELRGELALAGFFLMAHWPNPETAPVIEPSAGMLRLVVDLRGGCFEDLKRTLIEAAGSEGSLGGDDRMLLESVEAWWKEIEGRCATDQRPTWEANAASADPRVGTSISRLF